MAIILLVKDNVLKHTHYLEQQPNTWIAYS